MNSSPTKETKINREKKPSGIICLIITIILYLPSCRGSGFEIAPPTRIHGVWQSASTAEETAYVVWVFTAENAIYEYHDPQYDIHSTVNLQTDLADKWLRDLEIQEDYSLGYNILINRVEHRFSQQLDEIGAVQEPGALEYCSSALFGRCWNLQKQ